MLIWYCASADEGSDQEWSRYDKDELILQLTQVSLLLRLKLARQRTVCEQRVSLVCNLTYSLSSCRDWSEGFEYVVRNNLEF